MVPHGALKELSMPSNNMNYKYVTSLMCSIIFAGSCSAQGVPAGAEAPINKSNSTPINKSQQIILPQTQIGQTKPDDEASALKLALKKISDSRALLSEQIAELELRKKIASLTSEINSLQSGKGGIPTGSPGQGVTQQSPVPGYVLQQNPPDNGSNSDRSIRSQSLLFPTIIDIYGFDGDNKATAILPTGEKITLSAGSKYKSWEVVDINSSGVVIKSGNKTQLLRIR